MKKMVIKQKKTNQQHKKKIEYNLIIKFNL
jgi:hypothetical protein